MNLEDVKLPFINNIKDTIASNKVVIFIHKVSNLNYINKEGYKKLMHKTHTSKYNKKLPKIV